MSEAFEEDEVANEGTKSKIFIQGAQNRISAPGLTTNMSN